MLAILAAAALADTRFESAVSRVEGMVWDEGVRAMAAREGLDVVNVTWEDTGRTKGSVWGPNISDMTIGVRDASGALHPMPVIRFDNFTDKTGDLRSDRFFLRVGNERGGRLHAVTLADMLQETRSFLSDPGSWAGRKGSLWAERDEHVLVSAQACFLPIPRAGEATFTPVLYNYQSYDDNPAVLTMVATREGTSVQVVENEGGYLSEVLWFNEDGERAPFTAMRLSDFREQGGDATSSGAEKGLDMVLVVQVPLKQRERPRPVYDEDAAYEMAPAAPMMSEKAASRSDVEQAVVGHGETEGPHKEIAGLAIERDPRFPVRVTVQFYKATSTGNVTEEDIRDIRRQIDRVYADAHFVGSLVTEGDTGRPTEWVKKAPADDSPTAVWAEPFWSWHTTD
jgi:hypothetical protein